MRRFNWTLFIFGLLCTACWAALFALLDVRLAAGVVVVGLIASWVLSGLFAVVTGDRR
jgi:ABC-type uncharacterized transport system permease subunit